MNVLGIYEVFVAPILTDGVMLAVSIFQVFRIPEPDQIEKEGG